MIDNFLWLILVFRYSLISKKKNLILVIMIIEKQPKLLECWCLCIISTTLFITLNLLFILFVIVFVLNNKQSNNNKCYFDIIIIN